jgi:hypothetical protein
MSIETTFGQPLDWERLENKRLSKMRYNLATNGLRAQQSEWSAIQDAMITAMDQLAKAFGPHLQALPKRK